MFGWLTKWFGKEEAIKDERFLFVKSLCEKNPNVSEASGRWHLGYIYEFVLLFPDEIRIEVQYNTVRCEWDVEIWSSEASNFLYYYDFLDDKPVNTIEYLIGRFDLRAKLNKAIEEDCARDRVRKDQIAALKAKYLGGD